MLARLVRLFVSIGCLFCSVNSLSEDTKYEIKEYLIDGLTIKTVSNLSLTSCQQGGDHTVYIKGAIGPDSSFAMGALLEKLEPCMTFDGQPVVPVKVILNSGGGLLDDGYKLGEIFRNQKIKTIIGDKTICASACAVAFLGGSIRNVAPSGQILFHAPYRTKMSVDGSQVVDCSIPISRLNGLKAYYKKMTNADAGERLFDRTMQYCSSSNGWLIEGSSAAELYDIATGGFSTYDFNSTVGNMDSEHRASVVKTRMKQSLLGGTDKVIVLGGLDCDELPSRAKSTRGKKIYAFKVESEYLSGKLDSWNGDFCINDDNLNTNEFLKCTSYAYENQHNLESREHASIDFTLDRKTLLLSFVSMSDRRSSWSGYKRDRPLKDKYPDYQCKAVSDPLKLWDFAEERKGELLKGAAASRAF